MKEFFTDILLDISDNSEKKASRVAIKILYFLVCIIISIWTAEQLGFKMTAFDFSLRWLTTFFGDLNVVVPILIVIFVISALGIIKRLIVVTISQLISLIAYLTYFERKSVLIHLFKENVIGKELRKTENFAVYVKRLKTRKTILAENYLQTDYYSVLLLGLWFIYNWIVPDKFPALYFKWINVGLTVWTCFLLLIVGFLLFFEKKIKEIEKIIRIVNSKKEDSNPSEVTK
jgi:hypothetical protein